MAPTVSGASSNSRFLPGEAVEYFSETYGAWLQAVVHCFSNSRGVYDLDIKGSADPARVRQSKVFTPAVALDRSRVVCLPTSGARRAAVLPMATNLSLTLEADAARVRLSKVFSPAAAALDRSTSGAAVLHMTKNLSLTPEVIAPKRRDHPRLADAPVVGSGGLDVCFVMDCTLSMGPWIAAAKLTCKDMIAALPAEEQVKRVAFVAYRDFGDGEAEVHSFSRDVDSVTQFIDSQVARGGNDIPEDVAGGIAAALALDWTSETRAIVLIADAPCHGLKYHRDHDAYPLGDPTGLSMKMLMENCRKSHIDFTLVQLTDSTDQMQAVLRTHYAQAAGPTNIRKFELRDLRETIRAAGGIATMSTCVGGASMAAVTAMSSAVTPSLMSAIATTTTRATTYSAPMSAAPVIA